MICCGYLLESAFHLRKPAFYICENKNADQLHGNRAADQHFCFSYIDSTIPLLPKSGNSSLMPFSVDVQPGSCRTWSETPKTGLLRTDENLGLNTFMFLFKLYSYGDVQVWHLLRPISASNYSKYYIFRH